MIVFHLGPISGIVIYFTFPSKAIKWITEDTFAYIASVEQAGGSTLLGVAWNDMRSVLRWMDHMWHYLFHGKCLFVRCTIFWVPSKTKLAWDCTWGGHILLVQWREACDPSTPGSDFNLPLLINPCPVLFSSRWAREENVADLKTTQTALDRLQGRYSRGADKGQRRTSFSLTSLDRQCKHCHWVHH